MPRNISLSSLSEIVVGTRNSAVIVRTLWEWFANHFLILYYSSIPMYLLHSYHDMNSLFCWLCFVYSTQSCRKNSHMCQFQRAFRHRIRISCPRNWAMPSSRPARRPARSPCKTRGEFHWNASLTTGPGRMLTFGWTAAPIPPRMATKLHRTKTS